MNDSTGYGTKYANPATATFATASYDLRWAPNGNTVGVVGYNSPYIMAYAWSSGWGSKYSDPASLPAGIAEGVAWAPNGATIVSSGVTTPFINAYPWSSGFGTKYSNPTTSPGSESFQGKFSPDGTVFLQTSVSTPFVHATLGHRVGEQSTQILHHCHRVTVGTRLGNLMALWQRLQIKLMPLLFILGAQDLEQNMLNQQHCQAQGRKAFRSSNN